MEETIHFNENLQRSSKFEKSIKSLRVVQRGIHFSFEFNLGERRIRHSPTRKLNDVIFNQFWVDLDMSHPEISITSQRIELQNSGSELPSGLPLNRHKMGYDSNLWTSIWIRLLLVIVRWTIFFQFIPFMTCQSQLILTMVCKFNFILVWYQTVY